MNRLTLIAGLATLALASGQAAAEDPNLARNLAASCASCHGTNGQAVAGAAMAPLAGESRELIVKRFSEFRSGTRPATIMHQIAKGFSDAEIELIAGYFAAQEPRK